MSEEKRPDDGRQENAAGRHGEWDMSGVRERDGETVHHAHRQSGSSGSHHSSSGSRRKRRSSRKKAIQKFASRHKWALINVGILLLFAVVIVVILLDQAGKRADLEAAVSLSELTADTERLETVTLGEGVNISAPHFDSDPVLICEVAASYLAGNADRLDIHRENDDPADEERPVTLRFSVLPPDGLSIRGYTAEVAQSEDFSDSRSLALTGLDRSAVFNHLNTNTEYYYRITAELSDGRSAAVTGSFHTADTPRILSVDGLSNVRDLGNWTTADGGVIRQGLIIRGSEALYRSKDSEERAESMAILGIRTELDLRSEAESNGAEVLDTDAAHIYFDGPSLTDCFSEQGMDAMRRVFTALAKEDNYPVYLHCGDGGARTGTVCCLLEAMLGMTREDILREYALTDPYEAEALAGEAASLLDGLAAFEGTLLADRAESYLLSCGVTAEDIQSIRRIMVEG